MFLFHVALSLGLIGLVAATFLYTWASCSKGCGHCFAKIIGIIVIILSIAGIACTYYSGMQYWKSGAFENRMEMNKMTRDEKR